MKTHVLCVGDSNTFGYCADPSDCADGGSRYNEDERWCCLLQKALGDAYLVIEEGLSGRTTVFQDPLHESMDALSSIYSILKSHEVIDLLVIMLGTNDTKERFGVNARCIALGMERLVQKCKSVDCWGAHSPRILIIAPPPIGRQMTDPGMGVGCAEKSEHLAAEFSQVAAANGCFFLDACTCSFNTVDYMHLSKQGHAELSALLATLIPELLKGAV